MNRHVLRSPTAVDAAVGGTLAAVGAIAGGPLGAGLAQAATPVISRAIERVAATLQRQSHELTGQTLAEAAATAGVDVATLVDELLRSRARTVLLARALDGAARSIAEEKVEWFAACIANGYLTDDDTEVDRELFFVSAFAKMEVSHVRLLLFLADRRDTAPSTTDEISDTFADTLCPVVRPLLATLEDAGILVSRVAPPATHYRPQRETGVRRVWEITRFGEHCLKRIGRIEQTSCERMSTCAASSHRSDGRTSGEAGRRN